MRRSRKPRFGHRLKAELSKSFRALWLTVLLPALLLGSAGLGCRSDKRDSSSEGLSADLKHLVQSSTALGRRLVSDEIKHQLTSVLDDDGNPKQGGEGANAGSPVEEVKNSVAALTRRGEQVVADVGEKARDITRDLPDSQRDLNRKIVRHGRKWSRQAKRELRRMTR